MTSAARAHIRTERDRILRSTVIDTHYCRRCLIELDQAGTKRPRLYCCDNCRKRHAEQRQSTHVNPWLLDPRDYLTD